MTLISLRPGQFQRIMLALTLLLTYPSYAIDVNFSGTLIERPLCIMFQDAPVNISFQSVIFEDVIDTNGDLNNSPYKKTIPIPLDCINSDTYSLVLLWTGDPAPFEPSYLNGNVPGYGYTLLLDGAIWPRGSAIPISSSSPPELTVIPVKMPGATISHFIQSSANATLILNYIY